MRIEGPGTLFLIFGKSDGWWSETFRHGDGANVNPATRLVCVALGSWRLVSRNDETSHESEVRMRESAEKLLGRLAPHFFLYCASHVAQLEAPCVANPDQGIEGLFADAGDASVLVHDDGRVSGKCLPQLLDLWSKNHAYQQTHPVFLCHALANKVDQGHFCHRGAFDQSNPLRKWIVW